MCVLRVRESCMSTLIIKQMKYNGQSNNQTLYLSNYFGCKGNEVKREQEKLYATAQPSQTDLSCGHI